MDNIYVFCYTIIVMKNIKVTYHNENTLHIMKLMTGLYIYIIYICDYHTIAADFDYHLSMKEHDVDYSLQNNHNHHNNFPSLIRSHNFQELGFRLKWSP